MNKLFKFWKWRIELKISNLSNQKKVEFLTMELLKELHTDFTKDCIATYIWTHKNNNSISVERHDMETIKFTHGGN